MNNLKFFANCETLEEVKKQFHKLAKEMHPDNGGDMEQFKSMKAEYENAFELYKNFHKNAEGKTYTKETTETAGEFADMIEKLLKFHNITIEVCGSWLWVSGDTKPIKDDLKEMRFGWSKNKAAWYFHYEPYKKHHKGTVSMDKIRYMYGSVEYRATHKDPDDAKKIETA